jgi:hypothetical protein
MPNYFKLIRKDNKEPEHLMIVDERLAREVGKCEPDPECWFRNWYNTIGLLLAIGRTWDQILDVGFSDELVEVLFFLEEHYTPDAWAGI